MSESNYSTSTEGANSFNNIQNAYNFIVEKNLVPSSKRLKKKSPDDIIENFFEGENSWTQDKIYKILNYSFETGDENFSLAGDSSLIEGYRMAYLKHFPIIINPNHFWLMILQGFSRHMDVNNNSERMKDKIVNFKLEEDKKKIISVETGINLFTASDEQWKSFIENLLDKISLNLNTEYKNLINLFKKKFSTSTNEAEIANNVTIISSFSKYFEYSICGTCGISKIAIEGTIADWKLLLEKVIGIENSDEEILFWTNEIKIIIQKIINTLETKNPDLDFYKNIVQNIDKSKECKPDIINGWIIKFIPYDKDGNKYNFNDGLNIDKLPSQITNLPFDLININKKGQTKIIY